MKGQVRLGRSSVVPTTHCYWVIILFSFFSFGSEPKCFADYESSLTNVFTSSDDRIQKIELFYENEKLDISFPFTRDLPLRSAVGVGMDYGFTSGKSFQGRSVFLQAGRKLYDSISLEGSLTYATLNSEFHSTTLTERLFPGLIFKAVTDSFYLRLMMRSYFLYNELMFPGAIESNLTGEEISGSVSFRPFEKLRLLSLWRHIALSDTNHRDIQEVSLLYGLMPTSPWVWLGFGVSSYDHKQSTSSYWSPQPHWAYGPRFESSFPLGERFQLDAGLNLSRFSEDHKIEGNEYFGSLALQYGNRNSSFFRLYYERGGTYQGENPYSSESLTITAHFLME